MQLWSPRPRSDGALALALPICHGAGSDGALALADTALAETAGSDGALCVAIVLCVAIAETSHGDAQVRRPAQQGQRRCGVLAHQIMCLAYASLPGELQDVRLGRCGQMHRSAALFHRQRLLAHHRELGHFEGDVDGAEAPVAAGRHAEGGDLRFRVGQRLSSCAGVLFARSR